MGADLRRCVDVGVCKANLSLCIFDSYVIYIVPLTYRNPISLVPPQLIHASHTGWLDKDEELKL